MKISKLILKFSYKLPANYYCILFKLFNIYLKYPIKLTGHNRQIQVSDLHTNYRIFNSRPRRIMRYSNGIKTLCDSILKSYYLTELAFPDNAIIVDIGANVGEASFALLKNKSTLKIIAIEPDPKDFQDLSKNLEFSNSILLNLAVTDFSGNIELFLNNDYGDTSFFYTVNSGTKISTPCTTLDHIYEKYVKNEKIFLIKCEAEGLEPEVLLGGKLTLLNSKYVCCDTGPERNGVSTFDEVHKILTALNFKLISGNKIRNLYINTII